MIVGTCEIEILIPESRSLKERRQVLYGFKARLRDHFNISICEVDSQQSWKRGTLAVATVGTTKRFTNQVLSKILDFAEKDPRIEVLDYQMEIY